MRQVAVIDDYQSVTRDMANWPVLASEGEVQGFSDHLTEERGQLGIRVAKVEDLCV